ncbi:hypothetical protein [Bifidobacterium breve]|uniref:hypothetical protein n=1 Tax=Bifidobacterium breve TaxID=1685 RepID=UPI00255119EF|nr:hypothetical protein [Bifidobacterium breve]MDK8732601.1 hypothetical protein [Bifidobacterium breve]
MTNLTTNQFDTFIDIISSEDYHAPLWSDDENALRNKGLLTSSPAWRGGGGSQRSRQCD